MISIIVHGGAWSIPKHAHDAHISGVHSASELGYELLLSDCTSMDAVEAAVALMEDNPTFNAGRGSYPNRDFEVEMDAMIMEGGDLSIGSVAAVRNLPHPVSLARMVLKCIDHNMLVGEGAMDFAREIGMSMVPTEELLTKRKVERMQDMKDNDRLFYPDTIHGPGDTVGAVALDKDGHMAVAISTGGTPGKRSGRVGDSPLVGSGAYVDERIGGACSTGWGESIMKVLLAKSVCDLMPPHGPMEACEQGIHMLIRRVNGIGGVVALDRNGTVGFHHNTPHMAVAWVDGSGHNGTKI